MRKGTTTLMIRFAHDKGVQKDGLMLVVYGIFDSLLQVDRNRMLSTDQTV